MHHGGNLPEHGLFVWFCWCEARDLETKVATGIDLYKSLCLTGLPGLQRGMVETRQKGPLEVTRTGHPSLTLSLYMLIEDRHLFSQFGILRFLM